MISPNRIANRWTRRAKNVARATQYLGQKVAVDAFLGRIPPPRLDEHELPPLKVAMGKMWELLERDIQNIEEQRYLAPENTIEKPLEFAKNSLLSFADVFQVKERIQGKNTKVVKDGELKGFPSYFLQNFHFQSDGYLSEQSARLYDHQVETVFIGSASAMRRQVLVPIHEYMEERISSDAVELLDLACGNGSFTQEIKRNHPDFNVHGVDLSPWYVEAARRKSKDISWTSANAEELPFEDKSFDILTCVYLFHELPPKARKNVVKEMKRVLKDDGLLVIEDSLQWGDDPELNGSLELFPKFYHEPYYKGYLSDPLEELLTKEGFEKIETKNAFYSKVVSASRS